MSESGPSEWFDLETGSEAYRKSQGNYFDWAKSYDQVLELTGYTGPSKVADVVSDCISKEKKDKVRILDVGAGTGLVGRELHKRGFRHIDALDPSEAMLNEAKKWEVYENYIVNFISGSPLNIQADSYDVLTGCGVFSEAHVPVEALHEMIRLVKPGGFVVLAISHEFQNESSTYQHLEPLMDKLGTDNKWKQVSSEIFPHYHGEHSGKVWCFQVL